jgi:hypothetical protein
MVRRSVTKKTGAVEHTRQTSERDLQEKAMDPGSAIGPFALTEANVLISRAALRYPFTVLAWGPSQLEGRVETSIQNEGIHRMRKLKFLGLTIIAMFAMAAVASAASAANFHSETTGTVTLKGEQATQNVFTTNTGAEVKCSTAKFEGTVTGPLSETASVHPTYENCTLLGVAATVSTHSCTYTLNANGGVVVACPSGNIEIVGLEGACTISVTNGSYSGVTYTNGGSGTTRNITVTANVPNIPFTKVGSCVGVGKEAKYTGTVLTKGFVGSTQTGIWRE